MPSYHVILSEYLQTCAVSAMLEQGWVFKPAKSYGWAGAARGPEFHVDQSMRTHILNGLYSLTAVVEYLSVQGYQTLSEADFRRVLVYYTLHDAYKDSSVMKDSSGTFDVPLEELERLVERMRLRCFYDVSAAEIRMASVSSLSNKVGDLQDCPFGTRQLLTFVHLADALASQQVARDYKTAERRLHDVSSHSLVAEAGELRRKRRLQDLSSSGTAFPALGLHYHELDDFRGLSTLMVHKALEEILRSYGLSPLLYFANGVLYIGPQSVSVDTQQIKRDLAKQVLTHIRQSVSLNESRVVAEEACGYGQSLKYRKDVFLFCDLRTLLDVIRDRPLPKKAAGFVSKAIERRVDHGKYRDVQEFYDLYAIPLHADHDEVFAQRWNAVYVLLMGGENIAEALVPGPSLEWLLTTFQVPSEVAERIREKSSTLRSGGVSDYCYIVAYHWLIRQRFLGDQRRSAVEVAVSDVQNELLASIAQALEPYDQEKCRLDFVNSELGIVEDIAAYVNDYLQFSFASESDCILDDQRLKNYEKARSRSHKRMCLICNRDIPKAMKSSVIITGIAEQQAQVFSNRLEPSPEVNGQMLWCPMCYLEFMLRKLNGQGYPQGTDYNVSYRLYLYILPDYSFTPQLWKDTRGGGVLSLLRNFHPEHTTVTRLPLRGSKEYPSVPYQWLTHGQVDSEWLEFVQNMFAQQALFLQQPARDGKRRRGYGNRITFSFFHPNYMLMSYDNAVSKSPQDKALAPTRTEVWAKALYTAALVHLLIGARVYITDRPYLTITRPEEMKTIIEMEGLPPLLYSLFAINRSENSVLDAATRPSESNARIPIATLPALLDLLAAIWEITAGLYRNTSHDPRNLDKQVASILSVMRSNSLAGATFYKMRERDRLPSYPQFTRACQLLLPQLEQGMDSVRRQLREEGYELLMDTNGKYSLELAQQLTDVSLKLFLPFSTPQRGRAHRYERLFRTGIEVIKNNTRLAPTDLLGAVAGRLLKTVERATGGVRPTYGSERSMLARDFATLLVNDLYLTHCDKSTSKLTHLENALADAIYFLTEQQMGQHWNVWKERKKDDPQIAQEEMHFENGDEADTL